MSKKDILSGMEWALTPFARAEIAGLQTMGFTFDLALALLDYQIDSGMYEEADIYELPKEATEPTNEV